MKQTKASKIKQVINHLSAAHSEYKHPYMMSRETIKRVGLIIISTDRGLCGGLNINLFKNALKTIREYQDQNVEIDLNPRNLHRIYRHSHCLLHKAKL